MLVPTEALEITGAVSTYASMAASGSGMRRRFCPVCGTHLFSYSSGRPQFTVVRVGPLDDPSSVRPASNIWTDSAPAWACVEQQPSPPARPGS